jgi:hypothetical protein
MDTTARSQLLLTGLAGLAAAILVGIGEYLLHFDPQARFAAGGYTFLQGIDPKRTTTGHFFGVLGATLYPIGCYHIYLMLRPASDRVARAACLLAAFGFIVGTVWIGSRASISALAQLPASAAVSELIQLYEVRYETLLQITRLTTLLLSLAIVWLSLSGRSRYPRWIAIVNPIVLLLANFALFVVVPAIGKHTMPIALNVAFAVFFTLSIAIAARADCPDHPKPVSPS